jgi:hypothetical protein
VDAETVFRFGKGYLAVLVTVFLLYLPYLILLLLLLIAAGILTAVLLPGRHTTAP